MIYIMVIIVSILIFNGCKSDEEIIFEKIEKNVDIMKHPKLKAKLDTILKNKWNDMKKHLINKNIDKAIIHFTLRSRNDYKQMYTAIGDKLPEIAKNMGNIELITIKGGSAKYRLRRKQMIKGKEHEITYYVYFVIDYDDKWRIERF